LGQGANGKDGRIVEVDPYGNKQYHKQQYVIRKDKIYETNSYGRIQYHKPSYSVGKDGRVVQTDAYGNKRHDKPHSTGSRARRCTRPTRTGASNSRSSSSRTNSDLRSEPRWDRRASHGACPLGPQCAEDLRVSRAGAFRAGVTMRLDWDEPVRRSQRNQERPQRLLARARSTTRRFSCIDIPQGFGLTHPARSLLESFTAISGELWPYGHATAPIRR
jgi:hypothetical protein